MQQSSEELYTYFMGMNDISMARVHVRLPSARFELRITNTEIFTAECTEIEYRMSESCDTCLLKFSHQNVLEHSLTVWLEPNYWHGA